MEKKYFFKILLFLFLSSIGYSKNQIRNDIERKAAGNEFRKTVGIRNSYQAKTHVFNTTNPAIGLYQQKGSSLVVNESVDDFTTSFLERFTLYPNPTSDKIFFGQKAKEITIHNSLAKSILYKENIEEINIFLEPRFYTLTIDNSPFKI